MDTFYVGCGSFERPAADGEYYIARLDDGTVVARGLLEDDAYALCAEMNALPQAGEPWFNDDAYESAMNTIDE